MKMIEDQWRVVDEQLSGRSAIEAMTHDIPWRVVDARMRYDGERLHDVRPPIEVLLVGKAIALGTVGAPFEAELLPAFEASERFGGGAESIPSDVKPAIKSRQMLERALEPMLDN